MSGKENGARTEVTRGWCPWDSRIHAALYAGSAKMCMHTSGKGNIFIINLLRHPEINTRYFGPLQLQGGPKGVAFPFQTFISTVICGLANRGP